MSGAPALTSAYLCVTIVPLLLGGLGPARLGVLLLHLVVAALLISLARLPERDRPSLGWWLPLLLAPLLYAELPLLNQWAGGHYFDDVVRSWEAFIFPSDPSATLAGHLPWAVLSEILHLSYLSFYPIIYLPILMLYLQGRAGELRLSVLTLMITFLGCYLVFIVFPVQGPRYLAEAPANIPSGPFRTLTLIVLDVGSSRGAAFPSSHMAVAVAQTLLTFRFQAKIVARPMALLVTGLGVGAVYGGFHYATDMLAGAIVGVAAALAVSARAAGRSRAPQEAARPPLD